MGWKLTYRNAKILKSEKTVLRGCVRACVYVRACVCMCVYVRACMRANACVYACVCVGVCVLACVSRVYNRANVYTTDSFFIS
jgi:hypothetical protein